VVSAPTPSLAREICTAAEGFRRDLAIEWLGHALPEWQSKCTIQVQVGAQLGAGGATSFAFVNGQPVDFRMTIQGSHARLLDSVLPHEITHTILATHFGRPLPRWADEGAATSVEDISERSKQDKLLVQFLTTDRGIAFNRMFTMREYPRDILPLYSQGYSLARYLIAQGGRKKFVRYIGDGLSRNNWTSATRRHYGFHSLSDLQITWLEWVRQGSPANIRPRNVPRSAVATMAAPRRPRSATPVSAARDLARTSFNGLVPLPAELGQRARGTGASPVTIARPSTGSWYARRRDAKTPTTQALVDSRHDARGKPRDAARPATDRRTARPQPLSRPGQVILEWSRGDARGVSLLR